MAGSRPPVNSAAIETPVTEPMVIRTRLGGMVSVCAPVAASSATSSPPLGAALLHLGKQHRRDRRHVGGLGARDARHQIHRADQHILQAAAHMAEQARQEGDHGARHAGHFDQQAEEDEQRHRQQNEMAHALVHAADQHHQRRLRGQRQIAEDRQAEREGDRHAGEDRGGDHADEKDQQVEIAEPVKQRRAEPEQQDANGDGAEGDDNIARRPGPDEPQYSKDRHQHDTSGQRRRAHGIGKLQRRRE